MSRRRKSKPQQLDAAKRQRESWNMTDMNHQLHVVNEDDAALTTNAGAKDGLREDGGLNNVPMSSSSAPVYDATYDYSNSVTALELIYNCDFYVPIHQNLPFRPGEWSCQLGQFALDFYHKPSLLPTAEQFWLYANEDEDRHLIYYEFGKEQSGKKGKRRSSTKENEVSQTAHWEVTASVPRSCLEALQLKAFVLHAGEYDPYAGVLKVKIMLGQTGVTTLQFSSEASCTAKKIHRSLQILMAHFHGFNLPDESGLVIKKENIDGFYEAVKQRHQVADTPEISANPQHSSLRPVLRPYQKAAVSWMLQKERCGRTDEDADDKPGLHCLYRPFTTPDGQLLYYNESAGMLVRDKPLSTISPPGGILADEMGLGKTVEVLSCLLCHPRLDLPPPVLQPIIKREKLKKRRKRKKVKDAIAFSTVFNVSDEANDQTDDQEDGGQSAASTEHVTAEESLSSSEVDHEVAGCSGVSDLGVDDGERETMAGSAEGSCTSNNISPVILADDRQTGCLSLDENLALVGEISGGEMTSSGDWSSDLVATATAQSAESSELDRIWNGEDLMMLDGTSDLQIMTNDHIECDQVTHSGTQSDETTVSCDSYFEENLMMLDGVDDDVSRGRVTSAGDRSDDRSVSSEAWSDEDLLMVDGANDSDAPSSDDCDLSQGDLQMLGFSPEVSGETSVLEESLQPVPSTSAQADMISPVSSPVQHDHNYMLQQAERPSIGDFVLIDGALCQVTSDVLFPAQDAENSVSSVATPPPVVALPANKSKKKAAKPKGGARHSGNVVTDGEVPSTSKTSPKKPRKPKSEVLGEVPSTSASGIPATTKKQKKRASKPKAGAENAENEDTNSMKLVASKGSKKKAVRFRMEGQELANDSTTSTVPTTSKKSKKKAKPKTPGLSADGELATPETLSKGKPSKKAPKNATNSKKQPRKNSARKMKISDFVKNVNNDNGVKNECNMEEAASKDQTGQDSAVKQEGISRGKILPNSVIHGAGEEFECVCGGKGARTKHLYRIQCEVCQVWQHAECLNYDTEDPFRGPYLCPHCHVSAPPIPAGATLIIAPSSISYQWLQEISKHIYKQRIKVFMYTGVHKQGFIQPRSLANHDIVVTTYETLRKEIDYVDLPHCKGDNGRWLRHPKRFMTSPSPIIAVEWWRVCLDEAQMVECTTTKTAEMALRLSAINRWCVTGTPIQRSIDDLHGLMLFLGVDPYWVYPWWKRLLFLPYCRGNTKPMLDVMSQVLWRTVKKDVLDQIELPAQTEVKHWLTFSPVEEHFYRQQLHECTQTTFNNLRKWTDCSVKLSSLDRNTLHTLLHPLTRIRQACCHPQAVRGRFIAINKSTMTMEDLLVSLTKKARLECEEAHRKLVFADNALAGLHIMKMEYVEAVERYRNVLRSIEEHKEKFRTDKLQLLHTLHNLHEVLTSHSGVVPPTLRDDQLKTQARELRSEYLLKAASFVTSSLDSWTPVRNSLVELQREFAGCEAWWAELLQWITYTGLDPLLIGKVKEDLSENRDPEKPTIATSFRDVRGLQYILGSQLEQLQTSHDALVADIQKLRGEPSRERINTTVECCLRPAKEILKICEFCAANEKFDDYEAKLFLFEEKGAVVEDPSGDSNIQVGTKRHGTWADSETETALKTLITFVRNYGGDRNVIEQGKIHLQILDALKKEFKCLRMLWMALLEHVQAYDELDMATMRLRLRLDEEELPEERPAHIIEPAELDSLRLKYRSDYTLGTNELKKKLSQLLYLKNLAMTQNNLEGGENPESCPVCMKNLGTKWSVLQCGHCYCVECIRILLSGYSCGALRRSIRCPVCRQLTAHADIAYVSTRGVSEETNEIPVKGDHSTKVEGVVRCILKIRQDEPDAKTLIFSTWADVLSILARALDDNSINYRSLMASNKFQEELWSFKKDVDIPVLLMTVHAGANGLNLTEATHVILVEPILNPSQELQAIGRIHRIGQTKPTCVHRFLVRGTIEERMYDLQQTVKAPVNSHNAEETNMTIGDLTSLFEEMAPVDDDEDSNEPALVPPPAGQNSQPERLIGVAGTSADQPESASGGSGDQSNMKRDGTGDQPTMDSGGSVDQPNMNSGGSVDQPNMDSGGTGDQTNMDSGGTGNHQNMVSGGLGEVCGGSVGQPNEMDAGSDDQPVMAVGGSGDQPNMDSGGSGDQTNMDSGGSGDQTNMVADESGDQADITNGGSCDQTNM